jgi:hypothetical protein
VQGRALHLIDPALLHWTTPIRAPTARYLPEAMIGTSPVYTSCNSHGCRND